MLVEGLRHADFPKIELHRPSLGRQLLFPDDPRIVAVATDAPLDRPAPIPVLDLNDVAAVGEFILRHLSIVTPQTPNSPA